MHRNLKFLYPMECFAGIARGSYLVCVGWITLIVSDSVATVGQVFIVAMLTTIILGPPIGAMIDRYNRKVLIIGAHLGIAVVLAALAARWFQTQTLELSWLFAVVVAASGLRLLHNVAHDGLIQATAATSDLTHVVARFRSIHLVSTVVGTIAAGSIIERASPAWALLFSAFASLVLILPMVGVRATRVKNNAPGFAGFLADISGGFEVFRRNRNVRLITILAGVSLPVGQLANAILSSFIRDDLGWGSEEFAIVDAAWPLGGMLAAMLLSFGIAGLRRRYMEYVFAIAAGAATIGLALCTTLPMLVLLHGLMGMTVWLCRIVIDARVLQHCSADMVGRTKIYVEIVFSGSAMVMCLSPSLVTLSSTSHYFLFWGGVMVAVSSGLWFRAHLTEHETSRCE